MRKPGHCTCGLKLIEHGAALVCPATSSHRQFVNPVRTSDSPWGRIEHVETLAAGVDLVATASHGGLRLSEEVQDRLPADLLTCFYHGPGWAEEDCETPLVLALLDLTDERDKLTALAMAMKTERYGCAVPLLEELTGLLAIDLVGGQLDPATRDCPGCGESIYPRLHHVCGERVGAKAAS